ncbi:actin-binding LIM protein 2 isoform X3 [Silurus meridionalis]|nr:actin-binding LIM protein 2 isoform X3 [Silurus meridionalis]
MLTKLVYLTPPHLLYRGSSQLSSLLHFICIVALYHLYRGPSHHLYRGSSPSSVSWLLPIICIVAPPHHLYRGSSPSSVSWLLPIICNVAPPHHLYLGSSPSSVSWLLLIICIVAPPHHLYRGSSSSSVSWLLPIICVVAPLPIVCIMTSSLLIYCGSSHLTWLLPHPLYHGSSPIICIIGPPHPFQQQAVHRALEQQQQSKLQPQSGPILCQNCGQACKGEVLRVQNKHFHIKCFVCKGPLKPHTCMLKQHLCSIDRD